jgi:ATP adenylyltransferase
MEYIEAARDTEPDGCVFCSVLEAGDPGGDRILARDEFAWVSLAKYPYNPGHLLILPVRHTGDPEDLLECRASGYRSDAGPALRRSGRPPIRRGST